MLESPEADALFASLGLYWSRMRADADMTDRLCLAATAAADQNRISLSESAASLARATTPVEAVTPRRPCVISRSDRNAPVACGAWLGMEPGVCLGPQPPGSEYGEQFQLLVGGPAPREGWNSYVLRDASAVISADALLDLPVRPSKALTPGVDFTVSSGVLNVRISEDPFSVGRYMRRSGVSADGSSMALEAVVWFLNCGQASSAMDELYGFACQLPVSFRGARRKRAINAFMDLRVSGFNPGAVRTAVSECAPGRPSRLYNKLSSASGASARKALAMDAPVMYFNSGISGCPGGIMAEWAESHMFSGGYGLVELDVQPMGMSRDAYWRRTWSGFDAANLNQYTVFGEVVNAPSAVPGAIVGKASPASWLISSLLRSLSVLVVDAGESKEDCEGLSALSNLWQYSPLHTHLIIVLKYIIPEEAPQWPARQSAPVAQPEFIPADQLEAGHAEASITYNYSRRSCA
jgi:hypothetical protein